MIELDGRSLMNRKKEAALLDMVAIRFIKLVIFSLIAPNVLLRVERVPM